MYMIAEVSQYVAVASFAEAWIEIFVVNDRFYMYTVASFAEAWIEIDATLFGAGEAGDVASFAEAWIEIFAGNPVTLIIVSPPSRRRGLKSSSFVL